MSLAIWESVGRMPKCLKILDNLDRAGIVITKRGTPIARVLPFSSAELSDFYGCMKEEIEVHGDILSTGISWDAES